jgi:hypothetical protein
LEAICLSYWSYLTTRFQTTTRLQRSRHKRKRKEKKRKEVNISTTVVMNTKNREEE